MRKSEVFVWVFLIAALVALICFFVKHEIEVRNHQSTTPSPTPPAFQPFYPTTTPPAAPMPVYAPPQLYAFAPSADQKEEDEDEDDEEAA